MGTGLLDSSDNDSDDVIVTPTSIGFTSVEVSTSRDCHV